ncbi:MAG: aminotransferase class III-fold pyridoxal phosphate-dependent enzyme [Pseudomonadota bacterium]
MTVTTHTDENSAWTRRADAVMPGLNSNYASFRLPNQPPPIVFERSDGLRLIDADGKDYIDFVCGMGPAIWGNGNSEYLAAIHAQVDKLMSCGSAVGHATAEIELAEKLVELIPSAEQVRFCISGSEADQLVCRLARGHTGKRYVLRFEGHYHGWLDPMFSGTATSNPDELPTAQPSPGDSAGVPESSYGETLLIKWNDEARLRDVLERYGDQIALVIMEAVMCNSACCPPREGFLQAVRDLCDQHRVLLCFDEVITGFRAGLGGAQELFGVTPDLSVFAKAMSGGLPLACVAGRREIMNELATNSVLAVGTFNSFPLAVAAALKSIEMLERDNGAYYDRVDIRQRALMEGIEGLASANGHRVLTQGPRGFFYLDFTELDVIYTPDDLSHSDTEKRMRFRALLHENGVVIGGNSRFTVSGELADDDIDDALARIEASFEAL